MCGIVGFSGKNNFNKDKIIQLLLINSFVRGMDSTGIYSPKNKLVKLCNSADDFLNKVNIKEDTMLMAHARAATVGNKHFQINAHPFQIGNITLLHNGTLINHWALLRKYGLDIKDYDVDSQVLCGIINKTQNFNVLSEYNGAAALLINNSEQPNILYAYRNNDRPLFKGFINGDMYISSIESSLKLIGCVHIKSFKKDIMYAIKDGLILEQTTIKSTPYLEQANNIITDTYAFVKYENTYLPMRFNYSIDGLTLDKEYLVTTVTDTWANVINDRNENIKVNMYWFEKDNMAIVENKFVKTRCDLTYKKQLVAKKNDTGVVVFDYEDGTVRLKMLKTNEHLTVGKNLLKRLTNVEVNNIINKQNDLISVINIPFSKYGYGKQNIVEEPIIEVVENNEPLNSVISDNLESLETKVMKIYNYAFNNMDVVKRLELRKLYLEVDENFNNISNQLDYAS